MGYIGADRAPLTFQGGAVSPPGGNSYARDDAQPSSGIARRQRSKNREHPVKMPVLLRQHRPIKYRSHIAVVFSLYCLSLEPR